MSADGFVIRAPASTANLGPGFDCAAAALDLWNELHVLPAADGEPLGDARGRRRRRAPDRRLAPGAARVRAGGADQGHRFHFVNRIPLERGLGSSAATVAAGITAGLVVAARDASLDEVLELGAAARGPRRQPRRGARGRRLPDLARRRAATRSGASPTIFRLRRSWSCPLRA